MNTNALNVKRSTISLVFALIVNVLCLSATPISAELLYDNLHILDECADGPGGCYTEVTGRDRRFAQQFLLGDNTSIDQVTVQLVRTGETVSGSLSIELWEDDGFGDPLLPSDPNRLISVLGEIEDVNQVPRIRSNFTFDTLVTGLEPSAPYWIVVNFDGLTHVGRHNSIGWPHTIWPLPSGDDASEEFKESMGQAGTNGAEPIHAIREPYASGWAELASVFGSEHGYFLMSVRGRAASALGDFDSDGVLTLSDLDLLVSQIGLQERQFDLNGDHFVDVTDVNFWVIDLSSTWIGDANLDGELNSSDFVEVFQAGKYETGELARWSEGDWNADQRFDSTDFIAAFQDGGFEMGTRSSVAVPEPSCLILFSLGSIGLCRNRHSLPNGRLRRS